MTEFKITDEKMKSELLKLVFNMQDALVRAFAMRPENNDVMYMKSKTEMIVYKISNAVTFAKKWDMPELVDSHWLVSTLNLADELLSLTPEKAWNKNRTIKPKVYANFIHMLEEYTSYIHSLLFLAMGNEEIIGLHDIEIFNRLCQRFHSEIEEHELFEAKMNGEIDSDTYMKKLQELHKEVV